MADGAVHPVVHIAAADSGVFDIDEDVVGGLQAGDRSVFEFDAVCFFEHEGEVLCVPVMAGVLVIFLPARIAYAFGLLR
jgi:hypothetical protein